MNAIALPDGELAGFAFRRRGRGGRRVTSLVARRIASCLMLRLPGQQPRRETASRSAGVTLRQAGTAPASSRSGSASPRDCAVGLPDAASADERVGLEVDQIFTIRYTTWHGS